MSAKIIYPRLNLFKLSNEADDFDGGINRGSQQKEEAEITEGASHAFGRVTGGVAESVGDTTQNPNQSSDGRAGRTFQTG